MIEPFLPTADGLPQTHYEVSGVGARLEEPPSVTAQTQRIPHLARDRASRREEVVDKFIERLAPLTLVLRYLALQIRVGGVEITRRIQIKILDAIKRLGGRAKRARIDRNSSVVGW